MNKIGKLLGLGLAIALWATVGSQPTWAAEGSPSGLFNIKDYGAVGNGRTVNTAAFNQAIQACAQRGGGTVVVPAGEFVTGTFQLLGNVTLNLETGAVVKGSRQLTDYGNKQKYGIKGLSGQSGEGLRTGIIIAHDADNIAITGHGVIDGDGTYFVDVNKPHGGEPADYDGRYTRQGQDFMSPKFGTSDGPVRPTMPWSDRPGTLIILANCRNVLVRDVTLRDSHNWTLNITECQNVVVSGITVLNNLLIPNNDGINITAVNARISDCYILAGDDAIAANDCENLTVTNCTLTSRSSAIRFTGGRYCTFQNLVIRDSNRGIGIYGSADTVLFSDIAMQTRLHTGHWWGKSEPIHISVRSPSSATEGARIQRIRFSNIVAESESGILIYGTAASMIRELSFDRVRLRLKGGANSAAVGGNFDLRGTGGGLDTAIFKHDIPGLYCQYVDGLQIHGFDLQWADNPPEYFSNGIRCENFANLVIDGFAGRQAQKSGPEPAIALRHGKTVSIRNCVAAEGTGTFLSLDNVEDQRLLTDNDLGNARQATAPAQTRFIMSGNRLPGP